MRRALLLLLILAGAALAFDGLDEARAEPNLERRSKLALDNAVAALKAAREAYAAGDTAQTEKQGGAIEESVDLAYASLLETGKNPRKSPRWFKHAEMETRELLRKVEDFQHQMGYNDRPLFDRVKAKLQQVHEDLLMGLMEGRKHK
ncbi:MAG: hypothetical protein LAP40_12800 [Acidobacteriia bacterium]|nr:hypothetical protein [Terriglobia bacterium]